MRLFLQLDQELIGSLDSQGCFHDPVAVETMMTVYRIIDDEARAITRQLLRCIGIGRSEALAEEWDEAEK